MMTIATLPKRIRDRISYSEHGCWLWTGCCLSNGYGQTRVHSKKLPAHRAIYLLLVGPIPDGLQIDHLCRTRLCVRPSHLEAVTPRENTLRSPIAPAAINASKVLCIRGHPLVEVHQPSQPIKRICRQCNRESAKRKYWRDKSVARSAILG